MTNEERVEQARLATELVENDVFRERIKYLKQCYFQDWFEGVTTERREQVWYRIRALDDFVASFRTVLNDGKLAQAEINAAQ